MAEQKRYLVDREKRRKIEAYRTGQSKGDVVTRGGDLAQIKEAEKKPPERS